MAKKAINVPAVQVNVTLLGVSPPVWRRLVLPGGWHLGTVHRALQISFGWYDDHLHMFEVGAARYGIPYDRDDDMRRETLVRVHEVLTSPGDVMTYTYDFGDDWVHEITVEEFLEPQQVARCLAGLRAAPPEDFGGPWGYQETLEAIADPAHPEHAERLEWLGGRFDPELVDVAGIDRAVARLG